MYFAATSCNAAAGTMKTFTPMTSYECEATTRDENLCILDTEPSFPAFNLARETLEKSLLT